MRLDREPVLVCIDVFTVSGGGDVPRPAMRGCLLQILLPVGVAAGPFLFAAFCHHGVLPL